MKNVMKRLFCLMALGAVLLVPLSCSDDILKDQTDLGQFSVLEFLVDKSQTNKYGQSVFCNEWEYSMTQMETWVDGTMTGLEEVNYVFPYNTLVLREDWTMTAQGMRGRWLYSYNHLFIDCLGTGGGNYVYQVLEVTSDRLVVRQESYPIGGPIELHLFHNNPSGKHIFMRFTYTRK